MAKVLFFRGSLLTAFVALPVRLCTRLPGQKLSDVPAHCGIWFPQNQTYFEAIVKGVSSDHIALADLNKMPGLLDIVDVKLPREKTAYEFACRQVGDGYDWSAPFLDLIGLLLSKEQIEIQDNRTDKFDCSRLVSTVLEMGGKDIPSFKIPLTPNQLRTCLP